MGALRYPWSYTASRSSSYLSLTFNSRPAMLSPWTALSAPQVVASMGRQPGWASSNKSSSERQEGRIPPSAESEGIPGFLYRGYARIGRWYREATDAIRAYVPYRPPPSPGKSTDRRFDKIINMHLLKIHFFFFSKFIIPVLFYRP